jgi:D-3-phosphoglycerate dehydrogenase
MVDPAAVPSNGAAVANATRTDAANNTTHRNRLAVNYRILTLNHISSRGLERLPRTRYQIGSEMSDPDGILVRSADMHKMQLPDSVLAIARAGAGTNNIPVAELSRRGIPVFNSPGANANAVKELVVASLFLAARNICQAWEFARSLSGDDAAIDLAVEKGKKNYAGFELPGRTLGVIGLGAIGVEVANCAETLGMKVLGYDPLITVQRAWQLSSKVQQALSLDDLCARSDMITVHVPLLEGTRGLINAARIRRMHPGAVLMNFSRAPIVSEPDVIAALESGHLHAYICDFPSGALKDHPRAITLPHLGASTLEAEENCAVMAADTLRDFLENGHIRNSVNFPDAALPRQSGSIRISIANSNIPNMVGQISTALASAGLNIAELLNRSRGEYAYTLIDAEGVADAALLERLRAIEGVLSVRLIASASEGA